jgi:hypothetical protein
MRDTELVLWVLSNHSQKTFVSDTTNTAIDNIMKDLKMLSLTFNFQFPSYLTIIAFNIGK